MDGYEWVLPVDDADFETLRLAGQTSEPWPSPEVRLLRTEDDGTLLRRASMPWLDSHALVLRDEAIDSVGRVLNYRGDILPLKSGDARFCLFAAHIQSSALDLEHSQIVRFSSGRILDLKRPVFHDEVVARAGAFKLREMPRGDVYFTQDVVEALRATGDAVGTDFELVYDPSLRH